MATESRRTAVGVSEPSDVPKGARRRPFVLPPQKTVAARLFEEGYSFSFFQAVRVLEQLRQTQVTVGLDGPQSNEIVRFRAYPSLSFPPSQIYTLDPPKFDDQPASMVVSFFGLTGPSGILPRHYTEILIRQYRDHRGPERTALRDWFDLFNHRLLSLFYRAWTKYRFHAQYHRQEFLRDEPDTFTQAFFSLIGLGMRPLRNRLRVSYWDPTVEKTSERNYRLEPGVGKKQESPERTLAQINDLTLIYYGGLINQRPRSAAALRALVEDFFEVDVEVKQFQGQWLQLEPDNWSYLGEASLNNQLGMTTVVGERVWDILGRIRLRVGPLTYKRFREFIPDKSPTSQRKNFFLLVHLVRLFLGPELSFDVQMVLKVDEIPECQLVEVQDEVGPCLGWNTWLKSQEAEVDAADAVFEGEEIVWVNPEQRRGGSLGRL
ncbi:MAG: type VI secretion system baseplate subunit TssG [Gemmataceae bacterium]